jgi:hypothetical protein
MGEARPKSSFFPVWRLMRLGMDQSEKAEFLLCQLRPELSHLAPPGQLFVRQTRSTSSRMTTAFDLGCPDVVALDTRRIWGVPRMSRADIHDLGDRIHAMPIWTAPESCDFTT